MTRRRYIMTENILSQLCKRRKKDSLTCGRCFGEIEAGQEVLSRRSGHALTVYHVECARELNIV